VHKMVRRVPRPHGHRRFNDIQHLHVRGGRHDSQIGPVPRKQRRFHRRVAPGQGLGLGHVVRVQLAGVRDLILKSESR